MKDFGAEGVVFATLMETVPETTAKFLLEMLKEEWMTEEAEKSECEHSCWRFVYDEPGVNTRCDTCNEVNV